jgi:aminopeptidase N
MEGWTTQMGFPLVEVVSRSTNGDGSVVLNLKQSW